MSQYEIVSLILSIAMIAGICVAIIRILPKKKREGLYIGIIATLICIFILQAVLSLMSGRNKNK